MSTKQTGVVRRPDGWAVWCKVCPHRYWRYLAKDERFGVTFATVEDALAQRKRHRLSEIHKRQLRLLSDTTPTSEDVTLARVFGVALPEPCVDCGHHHAGKIACDHAARLRSHP